MDGLGDHVRIGVLWDSGIDQAFVVLSIYVLLDGAARTTQAHGVDGKVVQLDKPLLHHQRRLAAQHEVVVGARLGARRIDDGVALGQAIFVQHSTSAGVALVVTDGHATLEVVDQFAVPGRGVQIIGTGVERRQHSDAVDKAVDSAPLPAHDIVHREAVHRGRLRHIVRSLAAGDVRIPAAIGRLVDILYQRLGAAVFAVADDLRPIKDRKALAVVVHLRLAQSMPLYRADEGMLVRARKDGSDDRMIG